MRKKLVVFLTLMSSLVSFAQTYHSWDGYGLSPKAHIRTLNIFANIIFDVDSTMDPTWDSRFWHKITNPALVGVNVPGTEPSYLLDYMDTVYVPGQNHGTITRVFGESSFDSLQVIGDFVVVNLLQSRMYNRFGQGNVFSFNNIFRLCLEMINETGGLSTLYGHNSRNDYFYGGKDLFFSLLYVRNTSVQLGGVDEGSGLGGEIILSTVPIIIEGDSCFFNKRGAEQCIGSSNFGINPTGVATHEIGHSLFGYNDFHTSGGNNRADACTMPWMNIQGGYGLMGAAGSGLVSCNGYERWRMHWKHPDSPYYIGARNFINTSFVNSDISKDDGNKSFTLRDFVTYGDAIRIKLPYKDSSITPNQYIWLEFHNVGNNDKLDFLQYSNDTSSCLYQGTPGIYAYYQVGRDILEGTRGQVWDQINRDNLRIISNEGFWDYVQYPLPYATDFVCTGWNWEDCYYTPEYSNPFCGYQDQEMFIVPKLYETDLGHTCDTIWPNISRPDIFTVQYKIREIATHNMIKNGDTVTHSISWLGDSLDAFSSHRKINMGTNPSTCNAKTYYTKNNQAQTKLLFQNKAYNDTTTYLTGLSIEMYPVGSGDKWRVKVRWDDYDITNDARWTGQIVLKGTEQVNLTRGYSITLAQNRTPAQRLRSTESGYFAEPTQLTCEAGSHLTQQPLSSLILTEKSRFVLDSGATYHLGDSAQILVQGKSSFTISRGADFIGGIASEIIVDSMSTLYVYDTAKLRREARIIVRPGGKLIVNGGTLTNACDGEMWEGVIVEGDSTQRQQPNKQGAVYLTNATIENARNAVSTRGAENNDAQWAKTGGIVQATNTLFRNNLRSADFLPYENHKATGGVASNASYFTRCTFIVDDTHLFAESNEYFLHHVTLYGVRGVKFNGCTFRNETIEHVGLTRGSAITAEEAGFFAQRVCPQVSNLDPCGCYPSGSDTVTRCSFEGFHEAVHAANSNGNYNITVDNCDFSHNRTGVTLSVADNARVSFCDFDLSDTLSYCGIELDNSTGYTVEENFFHRQTYTSSPEVRGGTVNSSGTAENVIRKNEFTRLNNGIIATGTNALNSRTRIPGLQFKCNDFTGCDYDIHIPTGVTRGTQGSQSEGADNNFQETAASSFNSVSSSNTTLYYYSATPLHIPRHPSSFVYINNTAAANSCSSTLCVTQVNPKSGHPSALAQYRALAEEYADLAETWYTAFLQPTDTMMPDNPQDAETATLQSRLSDLSAAMGDLARTGIRAILSDTVVDMALLKEWYGTIVETMCTSSLQTEQSTDLPVAAYQLSEVYSTEGDYAAANALLASLPQRFHPDEAARNEYANYLNLQRLQENVSGNWYRQTDTEISDLQRVAEYDNGRAARMAKEILCFFHHICYEDEPLLEWNGGAAGERGHRGGVSGNVSTPTADGLRLHPNPAHTTLTVESDSPVREITIYDLTGKTMMTVGNCPSPATVNVVSLPRGIYLLRAVTEEGVKTARFVKN